MVAQLGKGTIAKSNPMAHARTSLDGRDARQEGQYGAFLATGLGLEGLRIGGARCLSNDLGMIVSEFETTPVMCHEHVAVVSMRNKWSNNGGDEWGHGVG